MERSVSDPWIWVTLASACFGAYFAALSRSLQEFSRSKLEDQLERAGRHDRFDWLNEHLDQLVVATAILRAISSVFLVLGAAIVVGIADHSASIGLFIGATGAVLVWFWLVHVGLAWAVSEHVATPLVGRSLWLLRLVRVLTLPLTIPVQWQNEVVRRLVGANPEDELEDELRYVMEESEREGAVGEAEMEMIEAIVDFWKATVGEAMTPRIDVEGIQLSNNVEEIKRQVIKAGHSRFPVFTDNLDHIEGILYVKDLLEWVGRDASDFELKPLLREALFVPESRRISDLLGDFQKRNVHMAIVLDEYGGTAGLITVEDIVEEIVGEIRDEHDRPDEAEPTLTHNTDGTLDVDARVRIDDVNDEMDVEIPEGDYDTVGGWVFATLGRIPEPNEQFVANQVEVNVIDVERTHVKRVRMRPLPEHERVEVMETK